MGFASRFLILDLAGHAAHRIKFLLLCIGGEREPSRDQLGSSALIQRLDPFDDSPPLFVRCLDHVQTHDAQKRDLFVLPLDRDAPAIVLIYSHSWRTGGRSGPTESPKDR